MADPTRNAPTVAPSRRYQLRDLPPDRAFEQVRAAYASGRTQSLGWRRDQLEAIGSFVRDEEPKLLAALGDDLSKPRGEAWLGDLLPVANEAAYARRWLRMWTRRQPVYPTLSNFPAWAWTEPQPLGKVLILSPWNYPVHLALLPLVAAVAAGNAVVIKPSELAPATSDALAELLPRYLDPEAVVVCTGGADVAHDLVDMPFDHVFFTGSTATGRRVAEAAAANLTPVTLELGGKCPVIVTADADIEVAARRVAGGKIVNSGQSCVAPDYALVERPVARQFAEAVADAFRTMVLSAANLQSQTRIVNQHHYDRLASVVAGSGGAVVSLGAVLGDPGTSDGGSVGLGVGTEVSADNSGARGDLERRFPPTVVLDPDLDSQLMTEEIFGPVLPVVPVDSLDQAIELVTQRPKPLALYLFTSSRSAERTVLDATVSGGVCVNHVMVQMLVPGLPFGGVGPSGVGAYHGKAGFERLSHRKAVLRKHCKPDFKVGYPPFDAAKERILRRLL